MGSSCSPTCWPNGPRSGAPTWPVTVSGSAEGSALGAAVLALFATGRAETLGQGLEALTPRSGETCGETMEVDQEWTRVYERVRQALPPLLSSYDAVADLFTPAPVRTGGAGDPA